MNKLLTTDRLVVSWCWYSNIAKSAFEMSYLQTYSWADYPASPSWAFHINNNCFCIGISTQKWAHNLFTNVSKWCSVFQSGKIKLINYQAPPEWPKTCQKPNNLCLEIHRLLLSWKGVRRTSKTQRNCSIVLRTDCQHFFYHIVVPYYK